MFRRLAVLVSLVLTLGYATSAAAIAQDASDLEAPEFEGLESGYARLFMPDYTAMFAALETPGADIPEIDEDGVLSVMTAILDFDSADNAQKSMDMTGQAYAEEEESDEDIDLTTEEVKGLGDKAIHYSGEVGLASQTMAFHILVIKDGKQLVIIQIMGGDLEEGAGQVRDIADFMMDAKAGTDEVSFNEDGSSTGGVFDRMPSTDDADLIGDLVPFMDVDLSEESPNLGL